MVMTALYVIIGFIAILCALSLLEKGRID